MNATNMTLAQIREAGIKALGGKDSSRKAAKKQSRKEEKKKKGA